MINNIVYDIVYAIIYDVIYDIVNDVVLDVVLDVVYDVVYDIIPDVCVLLLTSLVVPQCSYCCCKARNPLYKKSQLQDPCKKLIEAHVATLAWHTRMQSRKFGMTAAELEKAAGKICRGFRIVEV